MVVALTQSTPLPVELLDFAAEKMGKDARLSWHTATEVNADYFELEVAGTKADAQSGKFHFLAQSRRMATPPPMQSYAWLDQECNKQGIRYYRLKQFDLDGRFMYSNIRALDFSNTTVNSFVVAPNPFHEQIVIGLSAEWSGKPFQYSRKRCARKRTSEWPARSLG
jgi:hypothetical protein